jgi:putative serine protease PepD
VQVNDEQDADREPTQPIDQPIGQPIDQPVDQPTPEGAPVEPVQPDLTDEPDPTAQWAPPAPGSDRLPVTPAAPVPPPGAPAGPEPTAVLPSDVLAPSLMPPMPTSPPPADLTVRRPAPGAARSGTAWRWPLVALLALVVGLGGGFLGALAYDRVADDTDGPGFVDGGLADVDLEDSAPLAAPDSVAAVAKAVLPSTVQIIAEYDGQEAGATGSGWVMDGNGHIVTNNHVVADAAKDKGPIVVVDNDRNRYDATVVGRSPVYDLAILYVEDFEDLVPAKLGYSAKLQVGEPVVAIGSPLSLPSTVTSGIVSYLHRPVTTGSSADDSSFIDAVQTDAAINPGNSGGPLVNQKGEVIGVNSAIATAGGGSVDKEAGNIGVGFAIPVEQVRVTADQILKTGKSQYPVIGAKVKTGGIPSGEGAELDEIVAKSPAEEAGLRKGDLITHVNGSRVVDGIALIVAIRTYQPGQTIEFTVERGSAEQRIKVTLDGEIEPG